MSNGRKKSGRRSRDSSLSPSHDQQIAATIQNLEILLRERDEKISKLEALVEEQDKQLQYRGECMERLKSERDALRKTNASLIERTAELSRKQSVGSFGSPTSTYLRKVSRAATVRPRLPPVPTPEPPPPTSFTPPSSRCTGLVIDSLERKGSGSEATFIIPPTEDSDESDMDGEEDIARANYTSQQNRTRNESLNSSSSHSLSAAEENSPVFKQNGNVRIDSSHSLPAVEEISTEAAVPTASTPVQSPVVKQNGNVRIDTREHRGLTQDMQVGIHKSSGNLKLSGSRALAQHLKQILPEKKNDRKLAIKESSTLSNGLDSPNTSTPETGTVRSEASEGDTSITSIVSVPSEQASTDIESSMETSISMVSPTSSITQGKVSKVHWSAGVDFDDKEEDDSPKAPRSMRARTHTLASVNSKGRRPMERGRRMLKELKKEEKKGLPAIKRQSSLTNLNRRLDTIDLELISPELAAWVRGKFTRDLEQKYGGHHRANKAATSIQRAYREYKLQSRFKQIQRDKHLRHPRAQSMRAVASRRPSILMKNRPRKFRKEQSIPDARDPALKIREKAQMLNRERIGHSHSGTRLGLMEQQRMESKVKVSEIATMSLDETLEATPPEEPTQVAVNIEGACDSESSTDLKPADKPDGLTSAHSADSLSPRPISIFSPGSSTASQPEESIEVQSVPATTRYSATLPRHFRGKQSLVDMNRQKKNIGVNHFNRKPTRGIQYLVMSDILEDDPRCVADFLMNQYGLSKEKIGEFLGEINSDFNMAVLECLVEHMDMRNKPIDKALRQFQQIFRMPGEAQKIDKIMEVFAIEYYKANKENAQIRSEDAAYMLSFAIMMLHTSLHNPSVRSRITKKQWINMNRGCNEGEHFPESMLVGVYDRILTHEFSTGADHTDEVIKIEKLISGLTIPKLADPQRRLLGKFEVHEVSDPNSKSYRAHWRTLFIFSDLIILCKHRGRTEFTFRDSFSLFNVVPLRFDTHYHKYGIQVHSSIEDKIVLQCSCESSRDRDEFLGILEEAIAELKIMETERIAELGTSLAAKPSQDKIMHGGSVKHSHRVSRGPGDLIVDSYEESGEQSDYVFGVGDIAVNTGTPYNTLLRDSHSVKKENRSSGDSGFDSQQPTPSPSPTEGTNYTPSESPSPSHTTYLSPNPSLMTSPVHTSPTHTVYLTPDPSLVSPASSRSATPTHATPTSSQTTSPIHLTPGINLTPPPRSKSSDAIRTLTVIPSTANHHRSPSADLLKRPKEEKSASLKKEEKMASPKKVKKNNPKRESSKKKSGLFSSFQIGKSKGSSSPRRRGSSDSVLSGRRGSYTPPVRVKQSSLEVSGGSIETRGRSSSSVDLTQTT